MYGALHRNTLTPVKYWIGLKCTSAGLYNWYDGTAYSYNYWVSPAPSCSNQCAYGDGTNSTQWSVDSPSAAYSVLCYQGCLFYCSIVKCAVLILVAFFLLLIKYAFWLTVTLVKQMDTRRPPLILVATLPTSWTLNLIMSSVT